MAILKISKAKLFSDWRMNKACFCGRENTPSVFHPGCTTSHVTELARQLLAKGTNWNRPARVFRGHNSSIEVLENASEGDSSPGNAGECLLRHSLGGREAGVDTPMILNAVTAVVMEELCDKWDRESYGFHVSGRTAHHALWADKI